MRTYAIIAGASAAVLVLILIFSTGSRGAGPAATTIFSKKTSSFVPSKTIDPNGTVEASVIIPEPEVVKQSVKVVK